MPSFSAARVDPASGEKARQLVVFLHGVGVDGNDLIGLAPYFAARLPHAAFLAPDAPFPYDMAPMGRQWFSLADRSPATILAGVERAAPILNGFLDDALDSFGLDEQHLALVGFSQGTMMALHVALRRPHPCAALVGYSGRLIAPGQLAHAIKSRPPMLLVHGDSDEMVPPASLPAAEQALRAAGIDVTARMCPGLGHGINDEGVTLGVAFLARHLGMTH
ncbi:MAG: alpha/beta fold hydrolase [Rhodospirillaceae bacterium]|nr:alpha/beta fold hydrolase [Rhodospirillaceae bacterium]